MANKTRFDLEQQILDCWNVTTDIQTILNGLDRGLTEDQLMNMLIGLKQMYELKFNDMFDTFESVVARGELDE